MSEPFHRVVPESAYRGETVTRTACTAHDVGADARETDRLIRTEQATDAPSRQFAGAVAHYDVAIGDDVFEQRSGSKGLCDTQYLGRAVGIHGGVACSAHEIARIYAQHARCGGEDRGRSGQLA